MIESAPSPEGNVTISLGVTAITDQDEAIDRMVKRADDALYKAKENGRDRVEQEEAEGHGRRENNPRLRHDPKREEKTKMSISLEYWKTALDAMRDAMCLLDAQGRMLWCNGAWKKLAGRKPDDPIKNVACSELLQSISLCRGPASPFVRMMESRRRTSETVSLGERWLNVIVDPLLDEKGEIRGAIHILEDVTEHKRCEEARDERMRLASLAADVGFALTRGDTLRHTLQQCAEHLVQHLDAAFARIWTLSETKDILILQASAGMYTHLDGPHGRLSIASPFKVPTIARERLPILTNTVVGDPHISDQEWAKREGMVAFAGYPLIVEDDLVGVTAMFARRPLTEFALKALAAISDVIALAVQRMWIQEDLLQAKEHLEKLLAERTDKLSKAGDLLKRSIDRMKEIAEG